MPSSGQLLGDEGREPIPPAIPEGGIQEVKHENRRANVVRLLPSGSQGRKLRRLASISARLFNEVNYERRQQFFQQQHVDFEGTWDKYYEKYKGILGVNAQAVLQKNNEAWSSFFSLLKLRKEGKLPPHMMRVNPPRYWKDRGSKERKLILVVRQDRYIVDEQNHRLILRDFGLEIEFAGGLRWHGKQGRLEIRHDEARNAWYASIPVEVGVETTRNGNESKHIVRGERKSIRMAEPRGNEAAGVDLGINILASAVTSSGTWLLYRGSRAKEDFFYLTKKIAEAQSKADSARNAGDSGGFLRLNRRRRRLFRKLVGRMAHLYWNLANHLVRGLWELGVSKIYLGYPHDIARERGNKLTVNMWRYRELMDAIELKAQEYGIRVYEVLEYNTSNHCAVHGTKVARGPRGVVRCPLGHKLHSDLNGALNILRRGAGSMPATLKGSLSFLVDHSGVAPAKGA
ncbi:MAG: transposase [Nitrososphaeria archaeon]